MLFRFCLYGFLKNQRYFEPFLMLAFLDRGLSFLVIGLLIACRDLTVNILEIPSGAIADSFGRRRSMMISFVAYIISFTILGAATRTAALFVGMFFYGVGDTFRTGTHKAMIFEWLRLNGRSDEKTKIYGLTRSWSQIGSAVSGLIAALFILSSGTYQFVFYFAIVPYVLSLVNFAGYPQELDGDHVKAQTVSESVVRLKTSLKKSIAVPRLRRLVFEAMCWDGFFGATKDYLQPVLKIAALTSVVSLLTSTDAAGLASTETWWNETRRTALLIGPIYASLSFISAWASRNAHRVVDRFENEHVAANKLWLCSMCLFVAIAAFGWTNWTWPLIAVFVAMHCLKNLWRPILISRFDSESEAHEGATVLSIESQAQRAATFVMAPAIGWMIDSCRQNNWGGEFWPIGVVGGLIASGMFITGRPATAASKTA